MCILSSISIYAQRNTKGMVVDALTNHPLSGATVSFQNKNLTMTDKDGYFTIDCSNNSIITVSFVGYVTLQQDVNCNEVVIASLVPSTNTLANVEITATSIQNKSILYQPQSISKLNAAELKRGIGLFLDDAISLNVPGVIMNRRSVSGGQQFNIRGYGNGTRGTRGINSNFDGQGYRVYLNGIPVTDAEGITTLDDIDFGSLGNIEIVKGPTGTLFGQAIAGAINFNAIKPKQGEVSVRQDLIFGSYGLQRYTTHFQTATEHGSWMLNYGKQKSEGFSIHNGSHKDFVNFSGDIKLSEKQLLTTYFGYTNSYDERLGELTLTQYENKDYSGNIEYIKRNAHSHVRSFRAGIGHTYKLTENIANTTSIFGAGFKSDASSAGGWTDKTAINFGLRSSFETKLMLNKMLLSGITGMEIQWQDAQVVGYNMKQNPVDTTTNGWSWGKPYWVVDASISNNAYVTESAILFTEWTASLMHDFSITAGIGMSKQKIMLNDRFTPASATYPSHFDTTYNNMIAPHFAINKVFRKALSLYTSYSTGYKAPVSSYFFVPQTGRVNSVLKPEKGTQVEVGSKGTIINNELVYQLALFSANFSDKMTSVAVPLNNTTTAYSYVVNGGSESHKGIELSMRYSIVKNQNGLFANITPFVNFTYSDFKYGNNFTYVTSITVSAQDTLNYSYLNVFGVPKTMLADGIDLSMKNGLYASVSHIYKEGANIALDKTSNSPKRFTLRKSKSYNLLNSRIGFRGNLSTHFGIDAFLGVDNITGTQYPLMIFINQLPDAYIPGPLKPVFYGAVNLKYLIKRD